MISNKLIDDLVFHLKETSEVWIAVALMKDSAFSRLQQLIPLNAKQNYLVGIDLPTEPFVLKKLKELQSDAFNAAIFKSKDIFHPKVYILKKQEQLVAFVGSGNLTDGGFSNNIEMNLFTDNQDDCASLLTWFNNLYRDSYPLSEENIKEYENNFNLLITNEDQNDNVRKRIKLTRPITLTSPLEGIDFSQRYFSKEHHLAFRTELWENRSTTANKERYATYNRFKELHEHIFPQFRHYGIGELDHHKLDQFIVSHYYHVDGHTSNRLNGMWLSYGKPRKEIKRYQDIFTNLSYKERDSEKDEQSFINHARLQIRIELEEINIWLLFGKRNGGSKFDRDHFREEMLNESYRNEFFNLLVSLPQSYYISLNDNDWPSVRKFSDPESLHQHCKSDNIQNHFIIGRSYNIADDDVSLTNLPTTVLSEFQRLYPLYRMMRDMRFKK